MTKERGNSLMKRLDRWLGPALIWLLSRLRQKKRFSESLSGDSAGLVGKRKTFGILVTAAIGDTLLASSLGRSLKSQYPEANVILITGASNAQVGQLIEGFDQLQTIPVHRPWTAVWRLRALHLDALIDTGQWASINAIYSILSGARFIVGFQTDGFRRHLGYDFLVHHSSQRHELLNFQALLAPFTDHALAPSLKSLPIAAIENDLVVCHLKPSGEKAYLKEWPQENWQALIDWLGDRGQRVYLSGGPEDRDFLAAFWQHLKHRDLVDIGAGRDRLQETVRILQKAKLVISVNTGIMHLAALLNRPLVALHGPTNPQRWGPLSKDAVIVSSPLPCAPCLNLGFDYGCDEPKCMRSLTLSGVQKAAMSFLSFES